MLDFIMKLIVLCFRKQQKQYCVIASHYQLLVQHARYLFRYMNIGRKNDLTVSEDSTDDPIESEIAIEHSSVSKEFANTAMRRI